MKKNLQIIVFALLAIISTFIVTELSIQMIKTGDGCVNLIFTELCNPFFVVGLTLLPVFYGFLYLLSNTINKETIITNNIINENKTTSERIEEEMINQYAEKIEEMQNKIKGIGAKEKTEKEKTEKTLWGFCNELNLSQGLLYKLNNTNNVIYELAATFAVIGDLDKIKTFEFGIGVNGQVAKSGNAVCINDIPTDYLKVVSGLGESHPKMLMLIPIKNSENKTIGIVEASSFADFNTKELNTVYQIAQNIFQEVI